MSAQHKQITCTEIECWNRIRTVLEQTGVVGPEHGHEFVAELAVTLLANDQECMDEFRAKYDEIVRMLKRKESELDFIEQLNASLSGATSTQQMFGRLIRAGSGTGKSMLVQRMVQNAISPMGNIAKAANGMLSVQVPKQRKLTGYYTVDVGKLVGWGDMEASGDSTNESTTGIEKKADATDTTDTTEQDTQGDSENEQ